MSGVTPDKVSLMLKKFICRLKKPTCISELEDNFRIPFFCGVILLLMRATLGEPKGSLLMHLRQRGSESMGSQWTTVKEILGGRMRWVSG